MPQNKFQQAKRVEITPLIFTGHEKKKLKVNKNLEKKIFFSLKDWEHAVVSTLSTQTDSLRS